VEPLTRGLPPSDPRSLRPPSSTEFVEPPNKITGYATAQFPESSLAEQNPVTLQKRLPLSVCPHVSWDQRPRIRRRQPPLSPVFNCHNDVTEWYAVIMYFCKLRNIIDQTSFQLKLCVSDTTVFYSYVNWELVSCLKFRCLDFSSRNESNSKTELNWNTDTLPAYPYFQLNTSLFIVHTTLLLAEMNGTFIPCYFSKYPSCNTHLKSMSRRVTRYAIWCFFDRVSLCITIT
jgi:hypothetical protein